MHQSCVRPGSHVLSKAPDDQVTMDGGPEWLCQASAPVAAYLV